MIDDFATLTHDDIVARIEDAVTEVDGLRDVTAVRDVSMGWTGPRDRRRIDVVIRLQRGENDSDLQSRLDAAASALESVRDAKGLDARHDGAGSYSVAFMYFAERAT